MTHCDFTNHFKCVLVMKCNPIQQTGDVIAIGNTENPQYSDVIQFECQNDKEIKGEKQIHCNDKGEWSASLPTCEGA